MERAWIAALGVVHDAEYERPIKVSDEKCANFCTADFTGLSQTSALTHLRATMRRQPDIESPKTT